MDGLTWRLQSKRSQGPELRALRNLGPAGFEDVTAKVKLDQVKLVRPRLIAGDVDGDGAADLIVKPAEWRSPPSAQ